MLVTRVAGADPADAVGPARALGRVATGEAVLGTAVADAGVPPGRCGRGDRLSGRVPRPR